MMIDRKFHKLQLSADVGYEEVVFPVKSFSLCRPTSGIKGITIFHFQNHTGIRLSLLSHKIFCCLGLYHAMVILLFLLLVTDAEVYRPHSCSGVFSSIILIRGGYRFPTATLTIIFSFQRILFSESYVGLVFKSSKVFHHK